MVKTAVVDEVLGASGLALPDDSVDSAKAAVVALIERASTQENGAAKVDRRLVDAVASARFSGFEDKFPRKHQATGLGCHERRAYR